LTKSHQILFIASWYPNADNQNWGIFIKRHAEAIAKFKEIVVLHVSSKENIGQTYNISISQQEALTTVLVFYKKVRINIPVVKNILNLIRYIWATLQGLKIIFKDFGYPILVHVNVIFPAGIVALLLKWYKNIPYIITEHWTCFLPEDGNYTKFSNKKTIKAIARNSSLITTVSENLKAAMIKHQFENNYQVIPNVVDTDLFSNNSPSPNQNQQPKTIVHVSSLDERQKNVTGILNTIEKLSLKRNDFILRIIGNGSEKMALEDRADKLNLLNKVIFLEGNKTPQELSSILKASDIFLLFSNYENLPCTMLEALACGLPVIATHTGGIPEHISIDRGILVTPKDEKGLFSAIDKMLDTYQDYDPQLLRQYAVDNFSYDKVGAAFSKLYDQILE